MRPGAYLLHGDARAIPLADASVQCVVTSPPYWGLRDYGVAEQIGLEPTPDLYVANMVEVFREVRRVLRDDGIVWLNLGDSYAGGGPHHGTNNLGKSGTNRGASTVSDRVGVPGLKPKDLVGIPWRVAFALQADGWWLRSDIIWAKPNPMPESITDRPTKAHEFLFLLVKGQWKSRVVQFSDLAGERVHLGKYLGTDPPYSWASGLCVRLATEIFDRAQRQQGFGLPPFYAEEWKQRADGSDGDFVRGLPPDHISTAWASRFLNGDATAEQFLTELHRLRVALRNGDDLLIGGVTTECLDAPPIYADGEGAVTIQHAGKIGKIEFSHNRIIVAAPTTCKYYYDAEAIKEPSEWSAKMPDGWDTGPGAHGTIHRNGREPGKNIGAGGGTRNRRTVWTIATEPYPEAHFATFPEKLVEPCILAGTSERGACPMCGTAWWREMDRKSMLDPRPMTTGAAKKLALGEMARTTPQGRTCGTVDVQTTGWSPSCDCPPADPVPCRVLDPFAGSGTTVAVAERLGRVGIGVELKPEYLALARKRTAQAGLL